MQKQIPSSVLVKDFNYRSPSLPMEAMGDIDESGIGFVTEFGAHFKSPEEGEALATVRAEEFKCRQNTYSGESNISDFSCGHVYSLSQHFRSDYNQSYMLTKVKHQGSQEIESWGNIGSTKYSNQFDCIPALLQFRPQRLAIKPRLFGIMNGVIDSEQDLGRADLDEQGRYKVQMPFDISGVASGMASRRIRMAQPYGGGGSGMSFPLVKGTEVIWTCIDGDIDRPIITGTVPNPQNPSVTNTENATSNVIKTTSGISMGFHDGTGSVGSSATGGKGSLAAQQQNQNTIQVVQAVIDCDKQDSEASLPLIKPPLVDHFIMRPIVQQQQMVDNRIDLNDEGTNVDAKQWRVGLAYAEGTAANVNDITREDKDVYLRLGEASTFETDIGDLWGADGWLDYTDGDHNSITKGNHTVQTDGVYFEKSNKNFSYAINARHSYSITAKNTHAIGVSTSSTAGLNFATSLGLDVAIKTGVSVTFANSRAYSYTKGESFAKAEQINTEASKFVRLKVDPTKKAKGFLDKTMPDIAAVMAVASSAVAAAITVAGKRTGLAGDKGGKDIVNGFAIGHMAVSAAAGATLLALALKDNPPRKFGRTEVPVEGKPASDFFMGENSAHLHVTGSGGRSKATARAIELKVGKDFEDSKPAKIVLVKDETKGHIILNTGCAEAGAIFIKGGDTDKGNIMLKVGETTVTITAKGIEFDTPDEIKMNIGGKNKFMVNEKGCHTGGDLFLAGSLDVGGDIKSGGNVEGKKIIGSNGDLGGAAAAPKKPEDPSGSGTKKLIDFWEKKIKENSE
jgi:hypothetical protein